MEYRHGPGFSMPQTPSWPPDVVSFDTTKTNSSSYFFRPCDGSMLLDMASDFLTRTLNCLAVQNRSDEKAEMV
jgi:hypothetical protein